MKFVTFVRSVLTVVSRMTDQATKRKPVPLPAFRVVELKIKIKSLGLEIAAIRDDEKRSQRKSKLCERLYADGGRSVDGLKHQFWHHINYVSLHSHRVNDVAVEARCSHLAYAFLRGHAYRACERKVAPKNAPDVARVAKLAHKFSAFANDALYPLAFQKIQKEVREWYEKQ